MKLSRKISEALQEAVVRLPSDVLSCIRQGREEEAKNASDVAGKTSLAVFDAILENLKIADKNLLPMCQDTGMFVFFVDLGRSCPLVPSKIEKAINEGALDAVEKAYYRRSVVTDPVFTRKNTQNNLPPIIHWNLVDGEGLTIRVLLKGFGSENCSSVRMLNPTGGPKAVIDAVCDIVRLGGGKPCPPIFLGVGIGGTMERSAYLSKRALLRDARIAHADPSYAKLEEDILAAVQTLRIGGGGFGGRVTALHVAIEEEPTHIAGMPLSVSINCWADRKAEIVWEGEDA
ncbi:MAG: fumarate hydratase [Sphaerochaeta sp.]|mgnify:CR=1 FL=1|jgi:fumarate hydratase subunit alpha|nr:fumarate hydratase [Spirochaetales bacterium]